MMRLTSDRPTLGRHSHLLAGCTFGSGFLLCYDVEVKATLFWDARP